MEAPIITAQRGTGKPVSVADDTPNNSGTVITTRTEVLTVSSEIVLNEEGAWELPPGFPSNGDYPGESTSLNVDLPYYVQRRVHAIVFEVVVEAYNQANELVKTTREWVEESFYVPIAKPFNTGYFQGITNHGGYDVALGLEASPSATAGAGLTYYQNKYAGI